MNNPIEESAEELDKEDLKQRMTWEDDGGRPWDCEPD